MKTSYKRWFKHWLWVSCALWLSACGTTVKRVGGDEVIDLSGRWNDTDSRLVTEAMVNDALSQPWLTEFVRQYGKQPTVIVGSVRNLSHEHINVNTFVADIERALINSGRVQFVASSGERGEIRAERQDQAVHAAPETRYPSGQELGADFMMTGQINTILDTEGRDQVRYYQVDLTLISLADNRKVWIGQKKIKKWVRSGGLRL